MKFAEETVKVLVPEHGYPFLSCYDAAVKDMKYISFTGWTDINAMYYFDCDD